MQKRLQLARLDAGRSVQEIADAFNSIGGSKKGSLNAVAGAVKGTDGRFTQTFRWDQFPMGSIAVAISSFGIGDTNPTPTGSETQIYLKDREPDNIKLSFEITPGADVEVFAVRNYKFLGQLIDSAPGLDVRIHWEENERGDSRPDTRYSDDNDITFIFRDQYGAVIFVEAAVVFRGRRAYVTFQNLFGGHIVFGREFEAEQWKIDTLHPVRIEDQDCFGWLVPETSEGSYPGVDPLSTFQWAPELIECAIPQGRFLLASECFDPLHWEPKAFSLEKLPAWTAVVAPAKKPGDTPKKWEPLAVAWYNESGGLGQCFRPLYNKDGSLKLDEAGRVEFDGTPIKIHFKQLLGERTVNDTVQVVPVVSYDYPTFEPMTWVLARVFTEHNGRLATSAIRVMPEEVFEDMTDEKQDAVPSAA